MPDRRYDPRDYAEAEKFKLETACQEYLAGKMSEALFTASLYARGFRSHGLRDEFLYWDRQRIEALNR